MTEYKKNYRPVKKRPDTVLSPSESTELLKFLLQSLPLSRNGIKSLLTHGQIWVNGKVVTQYNHLLQPGQEVMVRWEMIRDHGQAYQIKIIYEDAFVIVIEKPAGLLTIATEQEKEKTAYHWITDMAKERDQHARIFIVHRLDRETSGLMMFAKDETTKLLLQNNWKERMVDRAYLAVVEGQVNDEAGSTRSWLKETKTRLMYSSAREGDGLEAITEYKVLQRASKYTLLELRLKTGRKNQIRVHMKDMGHSIVGDRKYGATSSPIKRVALHAHILAFYHPQTQELMRFETEVPKKFMELMRK